MCGWFGVHFSPSDHRESAGSLAVPLVPLTPSTFPSLVSVATHSQDLSAMILCCIFECVYSCQQECNPGRISARFSQLFPFSWMYKQFYLTSSFIIDNFLLKRNGNEAIKKESLSL
eukprot:m.121324 g.121324  ORF g.121324 m.121324 type:complete len:116 (+) comp12921_c2_seq1:698-1045(+)